MKVSRKTVRWFAGMQLLLLLLACSAQGQNRPLERALERNELLRESAERRETEERFRSEEEEEQIRSADATPLGVDIKAFRLVARQDRVDQSSGIEGDAIRVDSEIEAPPNLNDILESYLGKAVSMRLLAECTRDVIQAWRDNHYPLVDVYYPPQNITGGKIQMVVREAVLGEKRTEGAKLSRPEYLLGQLSVEAGDRVNSRIVEADLDWLNENPVRQVHLIYERGDEDGTSDIVLEVTESNPFSFYGGLANTGLELTGENEWAFGFNWANPFRTEQGIGYHFTTDFDWESLESHSVIYQGYLPWRHVFRFLGAHVSTDAEVALAPGVPVGVSGVSRQASFEYRIPLQRIENHRRYRHYFTTGFDYKSTNTDLLFGGTSVFGNEVEVGQFRAQYEASFPDQHGFTSFRFGLTGSPGGIFDHNDDASFEMARAGTMADYWYGFADLERTVDLPGNFLFRYRGLAQFSSERLHSTEQLLGGGYRTVRGFDESVVRGDSGVISNFELVSPTFSMGQFCGKDENVGMGDKWNAFTFYDAAVIGVADANRFGEADASLRSAGLGLTCRLRENGVGRLSYGWALQSRGVAPADEGDGKLHFGVSLSY